MKLYIRDNTNREFRHQHWTLSDTKDLTAVFLSPDAMKALETMLEFRLTALNRVQSFEAIDRPESQLWFPIWHILGEVKHISNKLRSLQDSMEGGLFTQISGVSTILTGKSDTIDEDLRNYFDSGFFIVNLDELQAFLYFLMHTGAERVLLFCR